MTLALIAGTGTLPPHLAAVLLSEGRPPVVCEMAGFASLIEGEFMRVPFRVETLGTLLAQLKGLGVTDICMAGAMRRPPVDPSAIDAATAPLVPRLMQAMAQGDDGTLRAVIDLFEEEGFRVIGAHQVAPDLLPPLGVLTQASPPDLSNDLAVAVTAIGEMGRADMGQAMVVRAGHVLAREDDRGTDALLQDFIAPTDGPGKDAGKDAGSPDAVSALIDGASDLLGGVADWLSGHDGGSAPAPGAGAGAFLYKAPKPGQTLLVDMPTIGPRTAELAVRAGLAGIVVAEGGVMILDRTEVIEILDAHGLYLWVAP